MCSNYNLLRFDVNHHIVQLGPTGNQFAHIPSTVLKTYYSLLKTCFLADFSTLMGPGYTANQTVSFLRNKLIFLCKQNPISNR